MKVTGVPTDGETPTPVDQAAASGEATAAQERAAVIIRPAESGDAAAILDVMFSTAMSRESSWWKNTVDSITAKLAEGGGFVAEVDARPVGCVLQVRDADDLVLRSLAVRPEFEGRGIGTALVRAVEDEARKLGAPRVLLAVSASNQEVCPYYRALGYRESTEPYPHAAPGRPAPTVFTKELQQEILSPIAETPL